MCYTFKKLYARYKNCFWVEIEGIDDLFGLGELYDGVLLEIYLRMKRIDDAADCLERYVNVLTGEKKSLVTGDEEFKLKEFKNGILSYDDSELKIQY